MVQTPLSEGDSILDKYGPFNSQKGDKALWYIHSFAKMCILNRTGFSGERSCLWTFCYGHLVTLASVAER